MSERITPSPCPHCGHVMDAAFAPDDDEASPKEGNITICAECTELLQFGPDLKLEKLPDEVLKDIQENQPEDYQRLKQIRMALIMTKGKSNEN